MNRNIIVYVECQFVAKLALFLDTRDIAVIMPGQITPGKM